MAQHTILPHKLSNMYQEKGGKATTALFMDPEFSVRRYHFVVDNDRNGTAIQEAKTPYQLLVDWMNLQSVMWLWSHDEQYRNCMNLVAEMRHTAHNGAGGGDRPFQDVTVPQLTEALGEIKEWVEKLDVPDDTYQTIFYVYALLEDGWH